MSESPDPVHTATTALRRHVWFGLVVAALLFLGGAGLGAAMSVWWLPMMTAAPMAAVMWPRWIQLGMARAVAALGLASHALAEGRVAEAEDWLGAAEAASSTSFARRGADLVRAAIAWRSGDAAAVVDLAGAALDRPLGLFSRLEGRMQRASALALRALGRASTGDLDGARRDVAAVRASPYADPQAIARAELAEAIVLSRTGERAALQQHLVERRALLLERATMRDRSVVRALQRMLAAPRTTVYREAAPRERSGANESAIADWLSAVAPAAARFARAAPADDDRGALAPHDALAQGAAAAAAPWWRRAWSRHRWMLPAALVVVINPLFSLLGQHVSPRSAEPTTSVVVALCAIAVVWMVLRMQRRMRMVLGAPAALLRATPRTAKDLRAIARSRMNGGFIVANAELALAQPAERRGHLAAALSGCDHGIAATERDLVTRLEVDPHVLPDLRALRAFLLAATDRPAEARAELALLAERHPTYAHRAAAELRVALVDRLRSGDLASAAALAAGPIEDLTLSLRDETLLDMVRVVARPGASAAERERIQAELRDDPELARWVDLVAPALMSAFAKPRAAAGEGDAAAEEEAAAVEEASSAERARG